MFWGPGSPGRNEGIGEHYQLSHDRRNDDLGGLSSCFKIPAVAIRSLFDNIGRLGAYAGAVAAFLAGRWVAGTAAAALSVRGLATALVVLRGALIRTSVGALVASASVESG